MPAAFSGRWHFHARAVETLAKPQRDILMALLVIHCTRRSPVDTFPHKSGTKRRMPHNQGEMTMKTNSNSGLKVKTAIKSGGFTINHARSGLKVRTGIKAAGFTINHTRSGLRVRTGIKAAGGGIWQSNHSARPLCTA